MAPSTEPDTTATQLAVLETGFKDCRKASEVRADGMLEQFAFLRGDVKALTVAIRGKNGDPGMVGRLCSSEKTVKSHSRIFWSIFLALLGLVATLVIQN